MLIRRTVEKVFFTQLFKDNILILIGARQVGKTTLLKSAKKYLEVNDHFVEFLTLEDPMLLNDLNEHPEKLFQYININKYRNEKIFLLLDEIQYLKNPSNFLKYIYDQYHEKIKIVATGSSPFYIDHKFKDSLAGRKRILNIYPFSFSEFLRAKKEDTLSAVIEADLFFQTGIKRDLPIPQKRILNQYWQEYSIYGGYPKIVVETDPEEKEYLLKELYQSLLKKDIYEAGIKNENKFYMLLKLLASQCGELINNNELANTLGLSRTTIENYIYILSKSFIISICPPFYRNVRKELTKMSKVYFYDNGYRNSILKTFLPINDRIDSGSTLENIYFSELRKMNKDDIRFWRTQDKKEIDFIIDEKYAFEVKIQKKKYNREKYKLFCESYPDIKLSPLVLSDDDELDILDFSS